MYNHLMLCNQQTCEMSSSSLPCAYASVQLQQAPSSKLVIFMMSAVPMSWIGTASSFSQYFFILMVNVCPTVRIRSSTGFEIEISDFQIPPASAWDIISLCYKLVCGRVMNIAFTVKHRTANTSPNHSWQVQWAIDKELSFMAHFE